MIRIYPKIEFNTSCPQDGTDLEIEDVVIPGIHCLVNASCPTCGDRYYVDLPVGQAIWSPITLKQSTGEIIDPLNMTWFSEPLQQGFLNPSEDKVIPIVHKFFDADRIIIVNCLDYLYGHVLLKLLNVQRYLDAFPDLGCCILLPTQMMHLVPDGVAEIWEFPLLVKDCSKWYTSLQYWISEQIRSRKECFLGLAYSHPSHRVYSLKRFVRNLPNIYKEIGHNQPIILFNYREDRLWGRSLVRQQQNIQKLYEQLSGIFPDMIFVVIGFGRQNEICLTNARLIDLRVTKFDIESDRLWLAYMSVADCAIGIHGSNMLLPSGLAKSTLELVPQSRIRNTVQDLLFDSNSQDSRDALLYYRMLYGNETLSNLFPSTVTNMILHLLSFSRLNSIWFKTGEDELSGDRLRSMSQEATMLQAITHLNSQKRNSLFVLGVRRFAEVLLSGLE